MSSDTNVYKSFRLTIHTGYRLPLYVVKLGRLSIFLFKKPRHTHSLERIARFVISDDIAHSRDMAVSISCRTVCRLTRVSARVYVRYYRTTWRDEKKKILAADIAAISPSIWSSGEVDPRASSFPLITRQIDLTRPCKTASRACIVTRGRFH